MKTSPTRLKIWCFSDLVGLKYNCEGMSLAGCFISPVLFTVNLQHRKVFSANQ